MSDIKKRSVPISHIVAAFFFPPLAVFLTVGLGAHFWINLVLTLFFTWIPGIIHAFWLIFNHNALVNTNEAETSSLPNSNEIKYQTIDESQLNDDLSSAVGIDYRKLRNFLAVKDFESANNETQSLFLKFYIDFGRCSPDPETKYTQRIPCTDICTIDRLWVKYSKGRFGISVQSRTWLFTYDIILREVIEFAKREKLEKSQEEINLEAECKNWQKFDDMVGYRVEDDKVVYIYNESAPEGHLPVLYHSRTYGAYCARTVFFARVLQCLY